MVPAATKVRSTTPTREMMTVKNNTERAQTQSQMGKVNHAYLSHATAESESAGNGFHVVVGRARGGRGGGSNATWRGAAVKLL